MKIITTLLASLSILLLSPIHADAASRETVSYLNTVDGDTVKVMNKNGRVITLRLLLIDTPESVKPNTPVQPYSKEAKAYLTKLIKSGQLNIQYDKGAATDRHGRHLVYLFKGDTMINEKLVYNGYARVGYIYSQKHYLTRLKKAQHHAKVNHLRIWNTPGYVNSAGEGFITPGSTKTINKTPTSVKRTDAPDYLQNCTEVRKYYPYGITDQHPSFRKTFDRNDNKIGCEIS